MGVKNRLKKKRIDLVVRFESYSSACFFFFFLVLFFADRMVKRRVWPALANVIDCGPRFGTPETYQNFCSLLLEGCTIFLFFFSASRSHRYCANWLTLLYSLIGFLARREKGNK